ncbi:MAG: hypothetical protein A3F73_13980 [Gallionellales bacterium RIFCSPLOWO2_12_FULL_59_22]|nr:MAG: hypothetical protein A3F73_13980 [Gallionellales bacterium RIFCSPLOWO2_12_FULL_59_22]
MIMLVVMIIGAITIFVSSLNSSALKIERDKATAAALAQAKDALVGYAITYGDTHAGQVHGYLPCPDIDGSASGNLEGSSELSCGGKNVSSNGKLPWKTLGLPTLRDGHGECLWYAVSGTFQSNQKTDMMNWDTPGLFEILDASGSTVAQNVVAVVFAPGAALDGQNRASDGTAPTCGGNYTPANYLDNDGTINNAAVSGTANAISQFRLGASAQLNDQIIFITRDDIFNARNIRAKLAAMTQKAAECLADYGNRNSSGLGNKRLPWSGRLRNPTSDYWTDSNYDDEDNRLAGRLPYRVNTSDADTGNQIDYPYYQLASNGANCPGVADWPAYYPWWSNWKDHLFYALADDFKPKDSSGSCGTCLRVNGSGSYAAVVMFADRKLAGQSRDSGADRLNFANYLEGRNFTNGSNWFGNGNYQSGAETADFNDVLYCIRPDLTVTPC